MKGNQSRTDSGNSLLQICNDLGLDKVKKELDKIESKEIADR